MGVCVCVCTNMKTYIIMELYSSKTYCRFSKMTAALWVARREQSHNSKSPQLPRVYYLLHCVLFYFELIWKKTINITHQWKMQNCITGSCKSANPKCHHLYHILFMSIHIRVYLTNLVEHLLWKRKDRNEIGEWYKEGFNYS